MKKHSVIIAIFISMSAILWMASGYYQGNRSDDPVIAKDVIEIPTKVRVIKSNANSHLISIHTNGITKASKKITIISKTNGNAEHIYFNKGDEVKKNAIIIMLDKQDREKNLEYAKELLKQRTLEYKAAKSLENKGYNSKVKLAQASTELKHAEANLERAKYEYNNLEIKAGFDGILNKLTIEDNEYIDKNQIIGELIQLNPIEIVIYLHESDISRIANNMIAYLNFPNKEQIIGNITYLSKAADEKSKTFEGRISIPNNNYNILSGMSVNVSIPTKEKKLHEISPSSLSLNDNGIIGIKIIEENNIVKFKPINIVSESNGKMLIDGLNEVETIISIGQDFVKSGSVVTPVYVNNDQDKP